MQPDKIYSTLSLPAQSRLGAWQAFMSEVYYSVEIKPVRDDRVFGELREVSLDPLRVSGFRADAQRCFRHAAAARLDLSEDFAFIFPIRGPMHFAQHGRSGTVAPGDVVVLNSAEAYATEVPDNAANVTFKVACSTLRERVAGLDDKCGRIGIASRHLAPVVRHLGTQLLAMETSAHAQRLGDNAVDMLCIMLEMETASSPCEAEHPSLSALMYEQLLGFVEKNFRDPGLTPLAVAQANRISLRYLHKVFAANGTSFGRTLLAVRLKQAHHMLVSAGQAARNVADIAYGCGFSSQSHFSTRFRQHFGFSPRDTP